MSVSLCINPACGHRNSSDDLFCTHCQSELLLEGTYRVVRELGSGISKTFEVLNVHTHEAQVLKCIRNRGGKVIELFHREFRVLSESDHPGIPKATALFEFRPSQGTGPLLCLVMEKIAGQDLERYILVKGGPIGESQAVEWLEQLIRILSEIHAQGLLHRDIKPSNIILNPNGQLVMIDFGSVGLQAKDAQAEAAGTLVYTPGYAAPEHLDGKAVYQSDFFSLGRTFVYLLTGQEILYLQTEHPDSRLQWRDYVNRRISVQLLDLIDRLMSDTVTGRLSEPAQILVQLADIRAQKQGRSHPETTAIANATIAPEQARSGDTTTRQPVTTFAQLDTAASTTRPSTVNPSTANPSAKAQLRSPVDTAKKFPFNAPLKVLGLATLTLVLLGVGGRQLATRGPNGSPSGSPSGSASVPGPTLPLADSQICSARSLVEQPGSDSFGVIEVGSSGVKGEVIQRLPATSARTGYDLEPREEDIDARDVDPIAQNSEQETVAAVGEMFTEMQRRFSIPCEHIVIYGSSGFASHAQQAEAVMAQIEAQTGRAVDLISVEAEAIYVFEAVAPPAAIQDIVMIDIGSGNTKGAFLDGQTAADPPNTLAIDFGTKSFTEQVDSTRGTQDFVSSAQTIKTTTLLPVIRSELNRLRNLGRKDRVYLAGGIAWALATLTQPCQPEQVVAASGELPSAFVQLSTQDIDTFYNGLVQDPAQLFAPSLTDCSEADAAEKTQDIESIQAVFTVNQLIGGAEILRALSTEMNFSQKEAILFSRYAHEALPIGYLKEQLRSAAPLSQQGGALP